MQDDLRYVDEDDFKSFGTKKARFAVVFIFREDAWKKDGWIGKQVRKWALGARINGTVFYHAGPPREYAKYVR
jgi:hypothetical protein